MVVISLDSPSCGVCLFDPSTGGCIGMLPERPRIVPFEVHLSRYFLYGDGQRTWAGIIQVVLPQLSDAKGSGSLNFTYFGATVPFRSSKRLENGDRGQAANSPMKTPTQTWWNTKAWSELSPLGLPQLSVGLGANSGKHKPRHHVYTNDYYSNLVPGLEHSVEWNSRKWNKVRTEFRQIISSENTEW